MVGAYAQTASNMQSRRIDALLKSNFTRAASESMSRKLLAASFALPLGGGGGGGGHFI